MALNYSITHNGNTWNSTSSLDTINISNGSVTDSITSASTRVLSCAGKYMPNNLVIGDKTLNCANKIITGDVTIIAEEEVLSTNIIYCDYNIGTTYKTTDGGDTWTTLGDTLVTPMNICYNNGRYIVVGINGSRYSTDGGTTWTSMGFYGSCKLICYGNNRYIMCTSDGAIYYSTNGISWTNSNSTISFPRCNCFDGTNFIWVAGVTDMYVYTSSNGYSLTSKGIAASEIARGIVYGNGIYVLCCTNHLYYSSSLTSWTQVGSITDNFTSIIYAGGKFIAVANDNIYYSTDGSTWTQASGISTILTNNLYRITYSNGVYVCLGNSEGAGVVYNSTNGITWKHIGYIPTGWPNALIGI